MSKARLQGNKAGWLSMLVTLVMPGLLSAETPADNSGVRVYGAGSTGVTTLRCAIDGELYLSGRWQRMETLLLDVDRDSNDRVPLQTLGGGTRIEGFIEFDGDTLALCDRRHGIVRSPQQCLIMQGTRWGYGRGAYQRFHANGFLRGQARCFLPEQ